MCHKSGIWGKPQIVQVSLSHDSPTKPNGVNISLSLHHSLSLSGVVCSQSCANRKTRLIVRLQVAQKATTKRTTAKGTIGKPARTWKLWKHSARVFYDNQREWIKTSSWVRSQNKQRRERASFYSLCCTITFLESFKWGLYRLTVKRYPVIWEGRRRSLKVVANKVYIKHAKWTLVFRVTIL